MKSIVTGVLVAFIVLAVAFVARDAATSRPAAMLEPVPSAPAPTVAAPISGSDASHAELAETPQAVVAATGSPAVRRAPAPRTEVATHAKAATAAHKIVAMYFHGDVRCATCRKVEAYAKEAVEAGFGAQVAAGLVEFRPVNVDRDENRHFIQDYQLTNRSVVVTDEVDGTVTRWVKLDNVWSLVGDRPAYFTYVQDGVRGYLETR